MHQSVPSPASSTPFSVPYRINSVQKTTVYVRLQTDSRSLNHQTEHQDEPPNIAGAKHMLKKSKLVPIHLPVGEFGNRQPIVPARAQGKVPVRLVASVRPAERMENSTSVRQRAANTAVSHWPLASDSFIHPEDINAVGSMENWRLLLKQLSLLVGSEGSAAIFFHSIGQLGSQYPTLGALSPKHSWPEQLATVQNTLQQLPQSSAAFVRQSLWFRGCQLITKLLGLSLSQRLLHRVAAVQSTYQHG